MTDQNPPYIPPTPAVPQQAYQVAPKKPPLSPELKRTASIAGAVSFTVMSIGWGLFAAAVGIGLFASLFTWILTVVSRSGDVDDDYLRLLDFIETINPEAWVVPLVVAGVVGAGLWVLSLFISERMLARAKHPSPWGVTWAGAGVAIAASWFVSWIAWLPLQIASAVAPNSYNSFENGFGITIALGAVSLLLSLAVTAVVGWLSWWWMAHALRPAAPTPAAPVP